MAEKPDVVNAGEQISPTPSALPLKPDEQFRLINQRLDKVANEIEHAAKPPQFRLADVINLVAIIIGLGLAGLAAFGLNERMSEVSKHQDATEHRLDGTMNAMEQRLGGRLDKLSDQFTAMDERTSRIEGERSVTTAKPK